MGKATSLSEMPSVRPHPTPDVLNQKLWDWGPPCDSDAHQRLRQAGSAKSLNSGTRLSKFNSQLYQPWLSDCKQTTIGG